MEKYNYIIYHNNCIDGYAGFYLFIKSGQADKNAMVYPDGPHSKDLPPKIEGKNVVIIDVAYSKEMLEKISKLANKLLFIDHHVTIREAMKNVDFGKSTQIIYDQNHSGVSLVWKHFFGKKKDSKMPLFVKYIEDNDTGTWQYNETRKFTVALVVGFEMVPTFDNLKKWDRLLDDDYVKELIKKGDKYFEYKDYLIDKNVRRHIILKFPSEKFVTKSNSFLDKVGKYTVAVTNGGCPDISLLGDKIIEVTDCDISLFWNYNIARKHYIVSLRSKTIDVGQIAKVFGGGGHKLASAFGFSSANYHIDDLFVPCPKIDKCDPQYQRVKTREPIDLSSD